MNPAEVAMRAGNSDPELRELLDDLTREWAKLPADREGFPAELLSAYLRQAYGAGYVQGRESREDVLSP